MATDIPTPQPNAEFSKGDVVRLKSGGPKMTVLAVKAAKLSCQWFDRNGKMHKAEFDDVMLDAFVPSPRR